MDLFQTEKDNAVDAAYKETEDKLEALLSQKEAAETAQKEAEEAMLKAKEELAQVKADTEKKLKAAGSAGITVFKVHFEAVQG